MKKLYLVLALSLMFVSCGINNDVEHQIDLKKCQNDEDKISGCVEEYYLFGRMRIETPYKNGKINGVAKWYYENGNLAIYTTYKNDKIDGVEKKYYENGNLKSETLYKNGKKDGIVKYYIEDGNLRAETLYKNDKIDGIVKYYIDGNLAIYITHENDEWISGECVNGKTISIELLRDSSDEEILDYCNN